MATCTPDKSSGATRLRELAAFPDNYHQARFRFRESARACGAELVSIPHPLDGDLSCDIAFLRGVSRRAIVTVSGTHGIEGYCGSAIQGALLAACADHKSPAISQMHIHAVNCWGMNWYSRTDEENVDVNRNFVDRSQALPWNPGYWKIHSEVAFTDWVPERLHRFWSFHNVFVREHGTRGWNRAFSGGQYDFADGVMYGGSAPSWSHHTLLTALKLLPGDVQPAVILDIHTGVGKFAAPTLLVDEKSPESDVTKLTRNLTEWTVVYGDEGTALHTANFSGVLLSRAMTLAPSDCVGMVLEYGTFSPKQMIEAILYDRWTRQMNYADIESRRPLLELYTPADESWRDRVVSHSSLLWNFLIAMVEDKGNLYA